MKLKEQEKSHVGHIDPEVGVWHTVELTMKDRTFSTEYDGEVIYDGFEYHDWMMDMEPTPIRLQKHIVVHGDNLGKENPCPIEYRNIFIKEIEPGAVDVQSQRPCQTQKETARNQRQRHGGRTAMAMSKSRMRNLVVLEKSIRSFQSFVGVLLLLGACCLSAKAESMNWNQFRGPNGAGIVAGFKPPLKIVTDQAAWKTPLPPGKSSPVLWRDRIFLTGVEGDRLTTLALDANSGKVLWKRLAPETPLEQVHSANSVAASTPCVDEKHVYVYFGSYGLLCYDHEGLEQWKKPIPTPKSMYGVATSPILHAQRLILVLDDDADLEGSRLSRSRVIALDRMTGEQVWETPRPYNRGVWSSPMIWKHESGTELVVPGNGRVYGYEPATGAEIWHVSGFSREPIAVPVAGDGQLYVAVSMQGGRGDVELDPEPFWTAMLHFDNNGDGQIGRDEITKDFTSPFRPELPPGHPGFGSPLPTDPEKRRKRQNDLFDWRDKNKDGFWTRQEFTADMKVGRGQPNLAAIRSGGRGDITESHVRWNLRQGIPEIPSPIFHEGRLYMVRAGGILSCVHTDTGEVIYRRRLGASGQYSASPVIANDHLYFFSDKGVITVVKCGDEFTVTHQTDLDAPVAATPAMDRNSLYVRTGDALLAFR